MLLSREEKDLDLNDNRAPGCRNPMTGRDGKKLFQALIIRGFFAETGSVAGYLRIIPPIVWSGGKPPSP